MISPVREDIGLIHGHANMPTFRPFFPLNLATFSSAGDAYDLD